MYQCIHVTGVTISSIRSPLYLRSTTMSVLIDGSLINATCFVVFIHWNVVRFCLFLCVSHFCVYVRVFVCMHANCSLSLQYVSAKGVRNRLQKGWSMKRGMNERFAYVQSVPWNVTSTVTSDLQFDQRFYPPKTTVDSFLRHASIILASRILCAPWHVFLFSIFSHVSRPFVARVCTKLKLERSTRITRLSIEFSHSPGTVNASFRFFFFFSRLILFRRQKGIFLRLRKCLEKVFLFLNF